MSLIARLRTQTSLFSTLDNSLTLSEYQDFSLRTNKSNRTGVDDIGFFLLGLFGETGSLLSEIKKKQRDTVAYTAYAASVVEELGDVLWYFTAIASHAGLKLDVIAQNAASTLGSWGYEGAPIPQRFADLQSPLRAFSGPAPAGGIETSLLMLAGKVGTLVDDYASGRISSNKDALSAHLLEIYRLIVRSADSADVRLEDAALRNLDKIYGRWPVELDYGSLYDDAFDADEQIPRRIVVAFTEKTIGSKKYVLQKSNGINIGDRLTDNRLEEDDYRFHDVFHLGYAAILGWSPVVRALFRVKRKSDARVDETQDGARAILIEEGIATWIFNHGLRNKCFEGVSTLDYSLLKAVQELVRGYEVESRPAWQWEKAILSGFSAFRMLQRHRRGTVVADLTARSLTYEESQ